MQIYNRNEDLSKVFDRTWKANHNDDVKRAREKEKKFIDKLFNVKPIMENNSNQRILTPGEQAANLQKNINGMNDFNKNNRLNMLKGKFK